MHLNALHAMTLKQSNIFRNPSQPAARNLRLAAQLNVTLHLAAAAAAVEISNFASFSLVTQPTQPHSSTVEKGRK